MIVDAFVWLAEPALHGREIGGAVVQWHRSAGGLRVIFTFFEPQSRSGARVEPLVLLLVCCRWFGVPWN